MLEVRSPASGFSPPQSFSSLELRPSDVCRLAIACVAADFGLATIAHACRVVEDARDDIRFDCRVATLELMCRAAAGGDAR